MTISTENISDYAFVADAYVKGPVKAVVLSFHGLGYSAMKTVLEQDELEFAAQGAICVFPYYGPWSWMNRNARSLTDAVVAAIYEKNRLGENIPLILRGGSMGGHAALNFARYSIRMPAAVACNCPVTDPKYHAAERADLPRTFLAAYGFEEQSIDEVYKENSPFEQAADMPRVPYLIIHGTEDASVNKTAHSDRFVNRMREYNHNIEYIEVSGMGHTKFTDHAVYRRYQDFVLEHIV